MTNAIANIILPLFGIMLAGYLASKFRVMKRDSSEILNRFVFYISLPSLVFIKLSRVPVDEFFNWPFLGALGGGMLAMFCLGFLAARYFFKNNLTAQGMHGLTAMYSSTAYIGLPLILLIFGDRGLVPGIIGAVITGVIFLPMGIILAEVDKSKQGRQPMLISLLAVLRSPVLLSTAAGLTVSWLGVQIPQPIGEFCELLGGAFIPCALFAAGLFIADCSIKGAAVEISWLVFAKLLLHPLITWWLAYNVFQLEGILPAIAVLQATLPSGVPVFVLAQQYNIFVTRSSGAIVISTAISVLTLSAVLIILDQ